MTVLHVAAIALAAWFVTSVAAAQGATYTVSGTVRASAVGSPVGGATIELSNETLRRVTRTDDLGAFTLRGVPIGRYRLSVRQVSYREWRRDLELAHGDTSLSVVLVPLPQSLSDVRVRERLTGIYGVVGAAEDLHPLVGARVQVLGASRGVNTDAAGRFLVQIAKPGVYVVRITQAGFSAQVFSVELPAGASVEASRLLDRTSRPRSAGLESAWQDLDRRLIWRGMNSALLPGSQLRSDGGSLTDALQGSPAVVTRGLRLGPSTCLFINGVPRPGWPLDAVSVDEIEAVEVYGATGDQTRMLAKRWPPGAPCGAPVGLDASRTARDTPGTALYAVVWVKP